MLPLHHSWNVALYKFQFPSGARWRWRLTLPFLGIILSFVLATQVSAKEQVVLQLKWLHQFQFAGYYAAQQKGFYADEGLEVEIRQREPGTVPSYQLLSGEAHFAIVDSTVVLQRLQGRPLVVLAAIFQHSPLVLIALESSGIISPLELKNKKIMFQRNIDDAMLTAMFAEFALSENDYLHVPHTYRDDALLNGDADAMAAYLTDQPYYYNSLGKKINIISPANYGIDFYGDLLAVSERFLTSNTEMALAFRRASLKGWAYALEHPEEVIQWLRDDYKSSSSVPRLRHEAEKTERMILPKLVTLGHINPNRFKRIANTYKQLAMAPQNSKLKGLHYQEYLQSPVFSSEVVVVIQIFLGVTIVCLLILWLVNRQLKKAIVARTQALEVANHTLKQHLAIINQYVIYSSTDLDGVINQVSQAFCEVSGFTEKELLGKKHSQLQHPDIPAETYLALWQQLQQHGHWSGEVLNRSKQGNDYWIENNISVVTDAQGQRVGYTAIAIDITDKKRIEKLSITDQLTGLSNRLKLDEFFDHALAQAQRYQRPLSVVMLDIDHFKRVNDEFGHHVGDQVLVSLAQLVKQRIRASDLLGRWGGEEFVVICPDTQLNGARLLAEQCREVIAVHGFVEVEHLTCSFGIAQWRDNEKGDALFKRVDKALYQAKDKGRNRVESDE